MINRNIISLGGGGLSAENPLIDLYIIAQARKFYPKVCLLPTASGDSQGLIEYFNQIYSRYPCSPTHLSLFDVNVKNIKEFVMEQDVFVIAGGNSAAMLGVWRSYGLDKMLKDAYDNGAVLGGGSAGSVWAFNECITDSFPGGLSSMPCLNFLPYSHCPHFKSKSRQDTYRKFLDEEKISAGFAIDDCAMIHFQNEIPIHALHSEYGHGSYYMSSSVNKDMGSISLRDPKVRKELIFNTLPFSRQHKKVKAARRYCDEQYR